MNESSVFCPSEPKAAASGPSPVESGSAARRAGGRAHCTILLVSLATVAYGLLLARVFSATMWFGAGVLAVSTALFGLVGGAMLVYLRPRWYAPEATASRMAAAAGCFSVLVATTFLVHLHVGVVLDSNFQGSRMHVAAVAADYLLLSLPFVAAGACITIALARYPQQAGSLHAMNQVGAALGCLGLAAASSRIDAPTLVLDAALLGGLGTACCLPGYRPRRLSWLSPAILVFLLVVLMLNLVSIRGGRPSISFATGKQSDPSSPPLYERWNAFSRVAVEPMDWTPYGQGLSPLTPKPPIEQRWMRVDSLSGMVITRFDGDLSRVDYLRYDVASVVHYLRPHSRVLVLGSGGDRDVLAALAFRQREIVGVEANDLVLEAVHQRFGDFSGHLDQLPNVKIVHDEARAYLAADGPPFDIIQASLLDSSAASPGGPHLLVENSMYTVEAWQRMFERLSPSGIVSFSRPWATDEPADSYRLVATAVTALRRQGVDNPRDHLLVILRPYESKLHPFNGMATLLVSREPLRRDDVDTACRVARKMAFGILLSPYSEVDPMLARLAACGDIDALASAFPVAITPATDDRPFFFGIVRPADVIALFHPSVDGVEPDIDVIAIFCVLFPTVFVLAAVGLVAALLLARDRRKLPGSFRWFVCFGALGLGFVLVEIAMVERLGLMLGNPVFNLGVTMFYLLTAAAVGSWLSTPIAPNSTGRRRMAVCLIAATCCILLTAMATPWLASRFGGAPVAVRMAVAAGLVAPVGFAMGMAFPLSVRSASRSVQPLIPWLCGVGMAAAICGSVVAMSLSLCFGITAVMLTGAACFHIAALSLVGIKAARQVS